MKKVFFLLLISLFSRLQAQEVTTLYKLKKIAATHDTIAIEKTSINPHFFKVLDTQNQLIDSSFYNVNYQNGTIVLKENYILKSDSLTVEYLAYPEFLTKQYNIYDDSRVVKNGAGNEDLYQSKVDNPKKTTLFDGLNSTGSISRGITIGSNQNSVVNSNLDLQITGKISDKVSLRASIQDNNIQLENGGYSQTLDEFDQIFIELFTDKWNVRAGDLTLENRTSKFLNFSKKVQGLSTNFNFGTPEKATNVYASAALVEGEYARSSFIGQEGNQGPFKLLGSNGQLYIMIISGSERVYVNGILLKRGDNNDYTIDYNAGEVVFTSFFPITSEMRINIEYQYTNINYNRFITYFGGSHKQEKFNIAANVYSESDLENQPLQQNLTNEQINQLSLAGDDTTKMISPSAYPDTFSENKSLYKKVIINNKEVYQYSNVPEDVLYNVTFTQVGKNNGDYILTNSTAVGKIYEYIEPINNVKQGDYAPIIQLIAPIKKQVLTLLGGYNPSEKTAVGYELGMSNYDQNLFSSEDDGDNIALAGKIDAKQRLYNGKFLVDALANYEFIQNDFRTIERLFNIEFQRDWNLIYNSGNLNLLNAGLNFDFQKKGFVTYSFEKLDVTDSFSGHRNIFKGLYSIEKWSFQTDGSYLKSDSSTDSSTFGRDVTQVRYHFKNKWVGTTFRMENNQQKIKATNQYTLNSQKFYEYGAFAGRGDSTRVYTQIGYYYRSNDSIQNGLLQRVNNSQSIYLKSRPIQNENSSLSVFLNYRNLKYVNSNQENLPSLNSNIIYTSQFFNQFIQNATTFETSAGTIQQQDFTFQEVEPGKGVYMWIDYNGNGIQELEEFEIATFSDQAKFVLVFLPNQVFVNTASSQFSESLTFNTSSWSSKTGFKKVLSHFYDQVSFLINRKIETDGTNFNYNPFDPSDENLLGLNSSFRNSLFYNRGKQNHSVTYTFLSNRVKNFLFVGSQENENSSHQLLYQHLLEKFWLMSMAFNTNKSSANVENYSSRNYEIESYQLIPKISYLFSRNVSLDIFYEFQNKENKIGSFETLKQSRFGGSFSYAGEKRLTMNGEISFYENDYTGGAFSPVAYQMLGGLEPGKNTTWKVLVQKNLTQFLDINVNYQGRKNETSDTIHTGSVQLRAFF
ncbi:MAG TPA: hypothetical protein VN192_07135 [Flavobacterium sp.]|nr:hypothetical protein [Flavobacterium sp.]